MATTVVNAGQHLNLDELFAGQMEDTSSWQGAGHYGLKTFSPIKLAGNPRSSRFSGQIVHDFFSFGGWTVEGSGRVAGEMVQGPHAYMFGLPIVITAHEQPDETAYLVADGSTLVIHGTTYLVKAISGGHFDLEVIA
jgi:hypothetical protein